MRLFARAMLGLLVVGAAAGVAAAFLWFWPSEAPPDDVAAPPSTPAAPGLADLPFPRIAFVPSPVLRTWPPTSRDPFYWPFDARSPWNQPIGYEAQYGSPDDPITLDLRDQPGGAGFNVTNWTISVFPAEGPERGIFLPSGELVATVNVPDHAGPMPPLLPNDCRAQEQGQSTATYADAHMNLVTDGHVIELFAASRRCDWNLEVRYEPWEHDLRGMGIADRPGMHTGSRAYGGSSFGGLVRKWELDAGRIRHALAAALPSSRFRSGFVWPATSQDSHHEMNYRGNVPMGTLAALPPDFDLDSIEYHSPYGRVLAEAMQDFGVYLVDSAGEAGMKFYGEPAIAELPGWERINDDLRDLIPHLLPVVNNGPENPGGGGTPRAPLAPPLR